MKPLGYILESIPKLGYIKVCHMILLIWFQFLTFDLVSFPSENLAVYIANTPKGLGKYHIVPFSL